MSFTISFQNDGGELDFSVVKTEAELKDAVIKMVEEVAYISAGDKIVITETEQ